MLCEPFDAVRAIAAMPFLPAKRMVRVRELHCNAFISLQLPGMNIKARYSA